LFLSSPSDLLRHINVDNEEYGRREIDSGLESPKQSSKRFSFGRRVNPSDERAKSPIVKPSLDAQDEGQLVDGEEPAASASSPDDFYRIKFTRAEKRDVAAAFRILAATRSPDKEGSNLGAAAVRDDASVSALSIARNIEASVVGLIAKLGEIFVNGEQSQPNQGRSAPHLRGDAVFEFFCEQRILFLLLDIAKETPSNSNSNSSYSPTSFHGVVWSPLVKAQVFRTTSLLISDVRNHPILYYLLSNNVVNEMVCCMMPLQQWTSPALEKMMPSYVDLLTSLALQLNSDPYIFPFLTVNGPDADAPKFPLFSAALETATCNQAQSDSHLYGNCINVVVSILQTEYAPIRGWVNEAVLEQRQLADHLCLRLLERYHRTSNVTTGPVIDGVRSNAIAGQIGAFKHQIETVNEVFWSGLRSLSIRLCETLLRRVISVLLGNLLPTGQRPFLVVGIVDVDVIPEREALAQVSAVFLTQFFTTLDYAPFQRMLAVALLHPQSTQTWFSSPDSVSSEKYFLMPALNALAEGKTDIGVDEAIPNPFLAEIIKSFKGEYGDWRLVAICVLVESLVKSEAMDRHILASLDVIPQKFTSEAYPVTSIEDALATYLSRHHTHPSPVSTMALECVGSLSLQLIYHAAMNATDGGKSSGTLPSVFSASPLWMGLTKAWDYFCSQALKSQDATGVANIFLDLVEASITNRYTAHYNGAGSLSHICSLSRYGCAGITSSSEILVRKLRGVSTNDVESSRYFVDMAIHFRALCKAVERLGNDLEAKCLVSKTMRKDQKRIVLDMRDEADELTRTIGGLVDKPANGTDLDLRGRMTFRFLSSKKQKQSSPKNKEKEAELTGGRMRTFSDDAGVFRVSSHLMLVLDPTDMFVVKPSAQIEFNRGTVITNISLQCVIAAAADGEWLHVAVRHPDVGFLVKNGTLKNFLRACCADQSFASSHPCSVLPWHKYREHGLAI
jgi:hypothetical protein